MIKEHLPILIIIVPLLAAPLCLLFSGALRFVWWIAFASCAFCFFASIGLLEMVSDGAILSYRLGGYVPPFGIELRIDSVSAFVLLIITGASLAVIVFARASLLATLVAHRRIYFYICYLLALSGLLGVVATADAFNMFVFLEISSLSSYVLIALGGATDRRALSAAYNYLVLGTIGATFFVLGVGFLYAATGTLNMADLASKIPILSGNRAVQAGFALIITGLALKIAVFPLHFWLPNAYAYAPNAVTAFLSASATKAAIYALIRFLFSVFGVEFSFEQWILGSLFLPLAVAGMFIASAVAIYQNDLRKVLAWSSIAQISFIMLALSLENLAGVAAAFLHLFNHALMKAALFMALGCVALRQNSYAFPVLEGLGKRQPWTASIILISGAALVGVPLTAGFISKWVLLEAALDKNMLVIAFLIVAASLLTAIYVGKMIQAMFFAGDKQSSYSGGHSSGRAEAPFMMLAPAFVLALLTIYFGIETSLPLELSSRAAEFLLSGGAGREIMVLPK